MNKFNASFFGFAREGGEYRVIISANNNEGLPAKDIKRLDTARYMRNPVVLWQHDMFNGLPVGKTTRLEKDSSGNLIAYFKFLENDEQAERVKNAWDQGFIGAASVGWKYEGDKPILLEWSIVTVPRDSEALKASINLSYDGGNKHQMLEGLSMGEKEELQKQIDDLKSKLETKDDKLNLASFGEKLLTGVDKLIDARFKAFDEKRNKEEEARKKEEEENKKKTASEEAIRMEAEHRATLLASVKSLLPDDFDTKKASIREIIDAALGEEADKYKGKSDGYVEAILDSVIENRQQAGHPGGINTGVMPVARTASRGSQFDKPLSTMELRNLARQPIN